MREEFDFEAALAALQDGQGLTGKHRQHRGGKTLLQTPANAIVKILGPPLMFEKDPIIRANPQNTKRQEIRIPNASQKRQCRANGLVLPPKSTK